MATERRNLYRLLYVQPEAPTEVIKASYRALMTTLGHHPDRGGEHDHAARLNAAYSVLSDAEQRQLYDRSLRRPPRVGAGDGAPLAWRADRRCPFCGHGFGGLPGPGMHCAQCGSPLAPAPGAGPEGAEILGRRQGERFARDSLATVRLPGQGADHVARLRDISFSGLSFGFGQRLPIGSVLRLVTPDFDTVALVVACRAAGGACSVHARLLTLQLLRAGRGLHVSVKA